jgi:hypothetical protein
MRDASISAGRNRRKAAPSRGSGEERNGIDLQLKLVPTANISGRVTGADSPASNWALHLVPSDTGDMSSEPDVATAVTDENGDFTFLCVPAGNYVADGSPAAVRWEKDRSCRANGTTMMFATRITATAGRAPRRRHNQILRRRSGRQRPCRSPAATSPISVLFFVPGLGAFRIDFQGSADRPTPDRLTTVLVSVDSADGKSRATNPSGRIDANGGFTIQGVLPGKYLIRVVNGPQGWTFKSAAAGGIDLAENAFDVQEHDIANVSLVFVDQADEPRGTVKGANGQPDGAAAVVVFPSDNRAWANYGTNLRACAWRGEQDGRVHVRAVAGRRLFPRGRERGRRRLAEPAVLEQISRTATRISFSDGEKKTQDLTTINIRPAGSDLRKA